MLVAAIAGWQNAAAQTSPQAASAAQRMLAPGSEEQEFASDTGAWNVISTLRLTPDAKPIVSTGIIATRTMIGPYMQELMKPAPGSKTADFRRIAYLSYFRVEGCWQYVSMDTRFPVGIMPAKGCEKEQDGKLTLEFQPIPFVGFGKDVEGRMIDSNLVIERDRPGHEFIRQYWTQADGTGRRWLAVQYEYTRIGVK
ncbi:MAG TPA: hypothetical protein VFW98_14925 [Gemmatimonadaceae bacterium]|nr:hypothetical protein [Gemmatimonadaceae bacterium]